MWHQSPSILSDTIPAFVRVKSLYNVGDTLRMMRSRWSCLFARRLIRISNRIVEAQFKLGLFGDGVVIKVVRSNIVFFGSWISRWCKLSISWQNSWKRFGIPRMMVLRWLRIFHRVHYKRFRNNVSGRGIHNVVKGNSAAQLGFIPAQHDEERSIAKYSSSFGPGHHVAPDKSTSWRDRSGLRNYSILDAYIVLPWYSVWTKHRSTRFVASADSVWTSRHSGYGFQ